MINATVIQRIIWKYKLIWFRYNWHLLSIYSDSWKYLFIC